MTQIEVNALIEGCVALPHYLARKLAARTKYSLMEELVSAGNLGLVLAAQRFDPQRGCKFSTYAYRYIQWSMTDYLRGLDLLTPEEREAGTTHERYQVPIEKAAKVAAKETDVLAWADSKEVADLLSLLGDRERYILREYFWGEKDFREIAKTLKISTQRTSQISRTALKKMRAAA